MTTMLPSEALKLLADSNPNLCDRKYYQARDVLRAAIRRAWAIEVLDAFDPEWCMVRRNGMVGCQIKTKGTQTFYSKTTDAARVAVALAVFPTLSDAERARLGECP